MELEPARRAAWDAYLVVTVELLPALDRDSVDAWHVVAELTGLAASIRLWAPGWGPTGAVLAAAIDTALRLRRDGHHNDLARLLRVLAPRLFRLSSGRPNPRTRTGY
ncbi:hypothetical protein Prum_102910 [Phytohabitans rumicis]|uniref:Uncharacterized protein n=2 Tax=Phytohabitans rumicis TaxID=1076125 RepID=A0A6V8LPS3_9ACTN|nr:hypothetical protein Prum_102910 [Phytohabitans rumicis]